MKISTLLIDDDENSRLITASFIKKYFPDISIDGEAETVKEALQLIEQLNPDLVLLDVELPDGTGFDLLRAVNKKDFEVIFITGYDSYAIDAFRFSAIDYLLKPFANADLADSLHRVKEKLQYKIFEEEWSNLSYNLEHKNNYDRRLAIASTSGFMFVDVKDIVRCESMANYTEFYFAGGKKMTSSRTLGFYEELLPTDKFCRIHHSHLINTDFLEQYIKGGRGGFVVMKDGTRLEVSQRKKEDFLHKVIIGR